METRLPASEPPLALAAGEVVHRIDELRTYSDREMEVRSKAATRVADPTDDRPRIHQGPFADLDPRQVAIPADDPVAVVDVDLETAALIVSAGDNDASASCGSDRVACVAVDIDPVVETVSRQRFAEPLSDRADEGPAPCR
jgi:hypothetical protein